MPPKKPPELTFQQHIADSHCSTPRVRFGHAPCPIGRISTLDRGGARKLV